VITNNTKPATLYGGVLGVLTGSCTWFGAVITTPSG
jgi:hypothetical protein